MLTTNTWPTGGGTKRARLVGPCAWAGPVWTRTAASSARARPTAATARGTGRRAAWREGCTRRDYDAGARPGRGGAIFGALGGVDEPPRGCGQGGAGV